MHDNETVPYLVFESTLAREERHSKRLITIIIVIALLWFMTIAGCVWYISLPIEEQTEFTQTIDNIDAHNSITQSIGDD